jgi:CubicO group peptidase (beta-lactamase class C family)/ketosteroid isomerase-like protein
VEWFRLWLGNPPLGLKFLLLLRNEVGTLARPAEVSMRTLVLVLAVFAASPALTQQNRTKLSGSNASIPSSDRSTLVRRLDALARAALERDGIPGLSVVVVQSSDTLLSAGYGFADLSHHVPATPTTRYRVQSLGGLLGVVLLQQVEDGNLSLDEEVSHLLPDFPWQGHRLTVRQLLDATSGLPDFHFLGDAVEANAATPKTPEDVISLFAGRAFTHTPGERYEWTISGFILAGVLLERLTGEPFDDYAARRVYAPAGMKDTTNCDDEAVVPDLARGYHRVQSGFRQANSQSASLYPFLSTICGTAQDAARFALAVRTGRLLQKESFRAMTTPTPASYLHDSSVDDPDAAEGLGVRLRHEGSHAWIGDYGSAPGYSGALMDFPAESVTVSVLSNSGGHNAYKLARQLAREVLALPALPDHPVTTLHFSTLRGTILALADLPTTSAERAQLAGAYRLRFDNGPRQFAVYERTVEINERFGHLMLRYLGEVEEPLLAQGKGEYAVLSAPERRFTFQMEPGKPVRMLLRYGDAPDAWRLSGAKLERPHSANAADVESKLQDASEAVERVLAVDEARRQAMLHSDVSALDTLLADDVTIFWGDGTADNKASALELFRSGRLRYTDLEYDDTRVRLYGDSAVVTGQARLKMQAEGREESYTVRVTRIYAQQQGRWRMVASQTTRVSPRG